MAFCINLKLAIVYLCSAHKYWYIKMCYVPLEGEELYDLVTATVQ